MSLLAPLVLAGSVARVGATVVGEKVRPRGPLKDPGKVPASVNELTVEWLTGVLCKDAPGSQVAAFTLGEGSDGTSSRRAIDVTYNEAGIAAGLPTAVYSKSTPTFVNRALIGVTGAAGAEALFYSEIRPELDLGAPAGYHGGWDPVTCRSMVLTEDITRTRQATFGSAAIHVDRTGAQDMVREMARYHGALWEDPRLETWRGLMDAHKWQQTFNGAMGFDRGAIAAFRLAKEEIPPAFAARKGELRGAFDRALRLNVAGPRTLLHQDVHPGNWFRLPDGSLHLYDWQGLAAGGWALDWSYAISAGLTVEDRRAWERDLLELYLQELGDRGGVPPSFDEAWLQYRQQLLHGVFFWTYTLLVGKVAELQPEDHVRMLIHRTTQAALDLDTLGSLA